MEASAVGIAKARALSTRLAIDTDTLCAWLLPVGLVTYLGIRGGGYDTVIASQLGIALWWLILLLVGFRLVALRLTRAGWAFFGLLVAYAAWTTLSLLWTESAEQTMTDVSQLLLYVAMAGLILLIRGRQAIRFMLHGLGLAIVAVAVVALLARLRFEWFGVPAVDIALPSATHRLSYPVNYWNALAALVAIGCPVLLYSACAARSIVSRAIAAAGIPVLALCAYLTASRGGVIEMAIALGVFFVAAPERVSKLAIGAIAGIGSVLVIAAASQRSAIENGLRDSLAAHQGDQLIAITLAAALAVALLTAAAVTVERHVKRPLWLMPGRRRTMQLSAAVLLVAIVAFAGAGGIGFARHEWHEFKSAGSGPVTGSNAVARLGSVSGEGRYQYWVAAVHEANADPLTGTGANTFQFYWDQHGTLNGGFVLDAHSLYMQSLGELGYPGFVLIVAFMLVLLGTGVRRLVRARDPDQRLVLATATAGAFAFAFAAAIDWIWFIPLLPVVFFLLAAAIVAPENPDGGAVAGSSRKRAARYAVPGAVALVAIAASIVIALPMAATADVQQSQSLVLAGRLAAAYRDAADAVQLQPYAATPRLQEALVEEQAGNIPAAIADARLAAAREPNYWSIWLVLSRLEGRHGNAQAALADYLHARRLNPHASIFAVQ
jgi:hypothetical protein